MNLRMVLVATFCIATALDVACAQQPAPTQIRVVGFFAKGTSIATSAFAFQSAANERRVAVELIQAPGNPLDMVRSGRADIGLIPNTLMGSEVNEDFVLFDLPFFFNNLAEVERVQESPVGAGLLSLPLDTRLIGLGFWNGGMSQIFGRAVVQAENLKGLRLRSTILKPARGLTEALGVTIASLPPSSVGSALQANEIDGVEVPPHYVANDVVPIKRTTISPINYRAVTYVVVANREVWKRLPLQVQLTVADLVRQTAKQSTVQATQMDDEALASLKRNEFTRAFVSPENISSLKEVALSTWKQTPSLTDVINAAYSVLRDRRTDLPPTTMMAEGTTVPIFFATDRNEETTMQSRLHFGGNRGAQARYGFLPVNVKPERVVGDTSAAELGRLDLLSKDDFIRRLASAVSSNKKVLVYVHGYHNGFADAVETAALMAADAKFDGVVAVFSWPSAGAVFDYFGDEDEVGTSLNNFIEFLRVIRSTPGVERAHLLAHSMGNRLVADALHWANGRPGYSKTFFRHIVLAAPDIYQEKYRATVESLVALSHNVTLYASDNDQALACSQRLVHGKLRAGQGGYNILPLPSVDTLDATPADPRPWYGVICTPFGHSYVMHNAAVLVDVQALLMTDSPPVSRFRLQPRRKNNVDYWVFQAAR